MLIIRERRNILSIYDPSFYMDTRTRPQQERMKKIIEQRTTKADLNRLINHIRQRQTIKNHQNEFNRLRNASLHQAGELSGTTLVQLQARQNELMELAKKMGLKLVVDQDSI